VEEDEEEEDVAPKARKRGAAKPSVEKKKPAVKQGKVKAKAKAKTAVDDEDDVEDVEAVPKPKVEAPATVDDESELSDIPDNFDEVPPKKRARKGDAEQIGSNKKLKSSPKKASPKAKKVDLLEGKGEKDEPVNGEPGAGGLSGDESEMSIVLDEPPPAKKKSRSRSTTTTGDVTKKPKAAGKPKKEKAPV